jgi:chitinase
MFLFEGADDQPGCSVNPWRAETDWFQHDMDNQLAPPSGGAVATLAPADEMSDQLDDATPAEKLSLSRVGILVLVVGLAGGAGFFAIRDAAASPLVLESSWSVPYVDVTLTPSYEFQDPQSNPARDIALGFVVADPNEECSPSWGAAYTLSEASQQLELDRRITQLRASGGDVMVSFGGQANDELAIACTDQNQLTAAYRSVIERFNVAAIDLDIEGAALADAASIERRAQAIAAVQQSRRDGGEDLAVWLTLPVATTGLTAAGIAVVSAALEAGVELTGVNVMTMNYNDPAAVESGMLPATISALEATAGQVARLYSDFGVSLDESERWGMLGATPMIGQNDIDEEVFTIEDAAGLATYATDRGLGRVSTWSINRDRPCGPSFADVIVHSNTCSGVEQEPLEFASVFTVLPGRAPALDAAATITEDTQALVADDPATSPYPIWRPTAQDPATAVSIPSDTPWALLGPVDPTDEPATPTTLAAGFHPDWAPNVVYFIGDQVLFGGLPYEARWNNQNEPPSTLFPIGPDTAWKPLFTVPGEPDTP